VGRHNALDKIIGHLARRHLDVCNGFALLTSRCSYELVQKAVLARIPSLVTVSAPTELAVEIARAANLTLIALARKDSVLVFNDPFNSIVN
jgi:FdhD protein